MPVEFLGSPGTNSASQVTARRGGILDLEYTRRPAQAHEDHRWDRILFAYHSGSPDPAQVTAYVAGRTERINLLSAHGYDIYDDAIDFGRYVIPLVRAEVNRRDAAAGRDSREIQASDDLAVLAGASR